MKCLLKIDHIILLILSSKWLSIQTNLIIWKLEENFKLMKKLFDIEKNKTGKCFFVKKKKKKVKQLFIKKINNMKKKSIYSCLNLHG